MPINPGQRRGVNISLLKAFKHDDCLRLTDYLANTGCNAAALNVHSLVAVQEVPADQVHLHHQQTAQAVQGVDKAAVIVNPAMRQYPRGRMVYPDWGQDGMGIEETPDLDRVYAFGEMLTDAGIHVVLKPLWDCHWPNGGRGGWRGWCRLPQDRADKFAEDYDAWLMPYAQIADSLDGDLCVQTEHYLITAEHGAAFWRDRVTSLRSEGYVMPVTASANWGPDGPGAEYRAMDWSVFDYIGISWYRPLQSMAVAELEWADTAVKLDAFATECNRPIAFMEVGWPLTDYADTDPFGGTWPPGVYNYQKALALARLFRQYMDPVLHSYYVWGVQMGTVGMGGTHNIVNTPLVPILRRSPSW